jgi:hypothetical protein
VFSKTDLAPVDHTPIAVFHQRDDGNQEAILHDILSAKATTQLHSNKPLRGLKQQRHPAQNAKEDANKLANGVGQYDRLNDDIELCTLSSSKRPSWRRLLPAVSSVSIYRPTTTDPFVELGRQRNSSI